MVGLTTNDNERKMKMKNLLLVNNIGSEIIDFPDGKSADRKVWKDTDGNYWAKYKDHWYQLESGKMYSEYLKRDITVMVCKKNVDPLEDYTEVRAWTPYSFKS